MSKTVLDPTALDDARALTGAPSDEKLAEHMDMSGAAVRNLRSGRSTPSILTLVKLRRITGRPIDGLIITAA